MPIHIKATWKNALLTTLLLISLVRQVYSGKGEKQVWDHHATLDNKGKFQLYWSADKNIVTFQAEVTTQGWVGFGISPDGQFEGSDIIIGGLKEGKEYSLSYKVRKDGKLQPTSNSWTLMSVSENKGRTILKFRTKLDTCNPESWIIPGETHNILYAYSNEDFSSFDKIRLNNKTWTMKMVKLLQPRVNQIAMPGDVEYYDFRIGNFSVPGNRNSLYACRVIKGPQLKRKHHIIKVSPIIDQENLEIVHHLFVVKCIVRSREEGDQMVSEGSYECSSEGSFILTGNCVTFYYAWGRGAGSFRFPTKAGMPIGEEPDEYYMLQMHYDNPSFLNGIEDNSGIRVYYTPKLRKYDAGVYATGVMVMSRLVVPPGQRQFIATGHGHPRCLMESFTEEIRVFALILHTHLIGRKIRFRHFRNGKELPPIALDNHFDHHYQEPVFLSEDAVVLPGDQLTVECTFDSSSRNFTTFGRERTVDEMCNVSVFHYPRISLYIAYSDINVALVAGLTGMDLTGGSHSYRDALTDFAVYDRYLLNYDWSEEFMCMIQNAQRFAPQNAYCQWNDSRTIIPPNIGYPEGVKPYRIPTVCPNVSTEDDRCNRYIQI